MISGLSLALFIIETSGKGGTLKQARDALLQKRPLYIMKPPATEERPVKGFDELVRLGAEPCKDVDEAVRIAQGHASSR